MQVKVSDVEEKKVEAPTWKKIEYDSSGINTQISKNEYSVKSLELKLVTSWYVR